MKVFSLKQRVANDGDGTSWDTGHWSHACMDPLAQFYVFHFPFPHLLQCQSCALFLSFTFFYSKVNWALFQTYWMVIEGKVIGE